MGGLIIIGRKCAELGDSDLQVSLSSRVNFVLTRIVLIS